MFSHRGEQRRSRSRDSRPASADGTGWPMDTRYYLPGVMDIQNAQRLIREDSSFVGKGDQLDSIRCVDLSQDGFRVSDIALSESNQILADISSEQGSARIIFVDQQRRYFEKSTDSKIHLRFTSWKALLKDLMIPPIAIELLHDNNGGQFQHISYCNDNLEVPCDIPLSADKPCAYHVCFKLCVWTFEHFFYSRWDFHSGTAVILIIGTSKNAQIQALQSTYAHPKEISMFTILYSIVRVWAQEVEKERWQVDFTTQRFESLTGVSSIRFHGSKPLPREKLRLRTDMAAAQDSVRCIARASEHTGDMFKFVQDSLWRFRDVVSEHEAESLPKRYYQQLSDSLEMRINQQHNQRVQIANLMTRLQMQWDVVNAVVSHYNNDLNIGMARDSRQDSHLMRRIALVTIVFLPATFMATFFSMGFFEVGDGNLTVSRWIWLYIVLTVPLTALLAWQYAPRNEFFDRAMSLGKKRDPQTDVPKEEGIEPY